MKIIRKIISHKKKLSKKKYHIKKKPSNSYIAELIKNGLILGRCKGRMEFGSRALGNRSILANPSAADTINKIMRVISKNGSKQSDKNLKLKKSDNDTKNKQNNLSKKTPEINNLPNILPTLKTDTLIPDLK